MVFRYVSCSVFRYVSVRFRSSALAVAVPRATRTTDITSEASPSEVASNTSGDSALNLSASNASAVDAEQIKAPDDEGCP